MKKLHDNQEVSSDEELQRTALMPGLTDLEATESASNDSAETARFVAPRPDAQAAHAISTALAERDAAIAARENLEQTVHALTVRLSDLEERVQGRSAELHEYERQINVRDRQIVELQDRASALDVQLNAARTEQRELTLRADRSAAELRALEVRLQVTPESMANAPTLLPPAKHTIDPDDAHIRAERYLETLRTLEGRRQIFDDMLNDAEVQIREHEARATRLEQELSSAVAAAAFDRSRIAKFDSSLEELQHRISEESARAQRAEQQVQDLQDKLKPPAVSAPPAPLAPPAPPVPTAAASELAAANERIGTLEQELTDHTEMIRLVHRQLSAAQAELTTSQGQMKEAQARYDALESHTRSRSGRFPASGVEEAALHAEIEKLTASLQASEQQVLRLQAESRRRTTPGSPLLVRRAGDTNIAHVLSGRTTIGRTPDNSIQIDSPSVSRHHAVLLLTAEGTVVEDLSSTNGIYINGTRVRRQPLREGDLLTIGSTEFRFVFKPGI